MASKIANYRYLGLLVICAAAGCHQPQRWSFTGPRVYLIEGAPDEDSDGLSIICHELQKQEVNARLYTPEDWLKIITEIDARPDEKVILVGHGHGAFLATQVVRHYAQEHKTKFIDAVFTIDAYNKDWPHNLHESGCWDPHVRPTPIPIGHNAIRVRNYSQKDPQGMCWGSDLVSTRESNVACEHPYYWYDNYWDRNCRVSGQTLREDVTRLGVTHETIDNNDQMVQRILTLCRKAVLSPFHYTPPEHHPDVQKQTQPQPTGERITGAPGRQGQRQP